MEKKELKELFINSKKTGNFTDFIYNYLLYKGNEKDKVSDFISQISDILNFYSWSEEGININSWINAVLESAKVELEINTLLNKNGKQITLL